MSDREDAIEKVMRGLSEAEARPGLEVRMERRVREALRDAAPAGNMVGATWPGMAWRLAAGGVALAALAGVLAGHRGGGRSVPHGRSAGATGAAAGTGDSQVSSIGRGVDPPTQEAELTRHARVVAEAKSARVRRAPAGAGVDEAVRVESFPAPAMPLTEEERLLLRVVHQRAPDGVAMLNPASGAHDEVAETEAFYQFFGRPMPVPEGLQQTQQGDHR